MAVENKYVNSSIANGRLAAAWEAQGSKTISLVGVVSVASADSDGSVYRVWPSLPASLVPKEIKVLNSAITSGTSFSLGLYKPDLGDVVSAALLASAMNLSSAHGDADALSGLSAVALADRAKSLWELAGQTISNKHQAFDIALTAGTVGSADGTVVLYGTFFNS